MIIPGQSQFPGIRPPNRLDKECLRRLYEFHKQLKALIAAKEARPDDMMSINSSSSYKSNITHHSNNLPPGGAHLSLGIEWMCDTDWYVDG